VTTLTLQLHRVDDGDLPDADLDVLLWDGQEPEAQLGAYVGDGWVNAQGEAVEGVHTGAHMPCLPVRRCKLTECQGKPRCKTCAAMDAAYPPAVLPVGEARELVTVPVAPQPAFVVGRIGREPELVPLPNGRAVLEQAAETKLLPALEGPKP
jgi:hypothetical protein